MEVAAKGKEKLVMLHRDSPSSQNNTLLGISLIIKSSQRKKEQLLSAILRG